MAKYGMVIDINKCVGCYNCFLACKDEYCGNDYIPYSAAQPSTGQKWMRIFEKERGMYPKVKMSYIAVPCMQCENAPCIAAAKNNAVYKRPDGIVIIDPEKAKGQKDIVKSCPYRVIYWNEEKDIPQKCTFCAHLLDAGWKKPRCAEACPHSALTFGDLDDPNSEVSKLVASGNTEVLHPEYELNESVKYIGVPKRFVAGTVVFGDIEECGENAEVTLVGDGLRKTVKADNYGDFEFEGLPPDTNYSVKVEHPSYKSQEFHVKTLNDVYLGDIILSPKKRTLVEATKGKHREI